MGKIDELHVQNTILGILIGIVLMCVVATWFIFSIYHTRTEKLMIDRLEDIEDKTSCRPATMEEYYALTDMRLNNDVGWTSEGIHWIFDYETGKPILICNGKIVR